MDIELLISHIQERRHLWDQREPNYHMRHVQKRLWKEVSAEMKYPEEQVKKKWRGLRDTFRKELMKPTRNKTGSGADACRPSSWVYFNQLSFLADSMKPRKRKSTSSPRMKNPPVESDESDDVSMLSDEGNNFDYTVEEVADEGDGYLSSASQASTTSGSHLRVLRNVDCHQKTPASSTPKEEFKCPPKKELCSKYDLSNVDETLLELEIKRVNQLEEKAARHQDGDYQFLMSLLSYLHDVPKKRKLIVRQKLMNILIEEFQLRGSVLPQIPRLN